MNLHQIEPCTERYALISKNIFANSPQPLVIGKTVIEQVDRYKLLGVYISSDLSWNKHVDYIIKKANKRLYSLQVLRRAGVMPADLVWIYCSLIRSVFEYASPLWAALPEYLVSTLE